MSRYVYYQPNEKDLKDRYGDCAIRAICKATNSDWLSVFDGLYQYARTAQCLLNHKPAFEPYLKDKGFVYKSTPKHPKVKELAKDIDGTVIAYVRVGFSTHLVCIENKDWYDTWNSGDKKVFGYYEKVGVSV